MTLYIALTATARNEQVCAPQNRGSKFSKISGFCAPDGLYSCAILQFFSAASQMAPQQNAKFRTASFHHFRSTEEG